MTEEYIRTNAVSAPKTVNTTKPKTGNAKDTSAKKKGK